MAARSAGLLIHVTSVPGRFAVGDLGPAAGRFLEWAESAGQSLWQILPIHPVGGHESPYSALSAFAGNPLLLSPERLAEDGLCGQEDLAEGAFLPGARVDFSAARLWKEKLLRQAWSRIPQDGRLRRELEAFRESPQASPWLSDWSLFAAVRAARGGHWTSWPEGLARRGAGALAEARAELADEIAYQEFLQFLFFRQWASLREEASRRGIALVGDLPIYVAHDSAEVWAHQELFSLGAGGRPDFVAGVPPDAFTADGQLWGYPLYRWDLMEADGFGWWIARMRSARSLVDLVRVDHFRAFAAYWAVPAGASNAKSGEWRTAPGEKLWRAVGKALGTLPVIAEDLGVITPDVEQLRDTLGIPGMKVLQFAFSQDDSPHLPHHHVRNGVVYTGTHDNDTARGWFAGLSAAERERVCDYLGTDGRQIEWDLIRSAFASVADRAIVPLQDVFGLGGEARMNDPGGAPGNWTWRARDEDFTPERAAKLKRLAALTGRI